MTLLNLRDFGNVDVKSKGKVYNITKWEEKEMLDDWTLILFGKLKLESFTLVAPKIKK